jgi:hypothetical protein
MKIKFCDFMNINYTDPDTDDPNDSFEMYIVRRDNKVLYVGISQRCVWNRWFGDFGRMPRNANGNRFATDDISREIVDNLPNSLSWEIELLSVNDCRIYFVGNPEIQKFCKDRLDIKDYEAYMIRELKPSLNGTYNG